MIHTDRVFNIKTCSADEMIADFGHTRSWTLCSGWRVGDTLYLNDAFSEDGAQEYAVIRVGGDSAIQFDSVTFGWMEADRIAAYIRETWNCDAQDYSWRVTVHVNDGHGQTCPLCA